MISDRSVQAASRSWHLSPMYVSLGLRLMDIRKRSQAAKLGWRRRRERERLEARKP